jgi:small-conductance mechanosensitive channel
MSSHPLHDSYRNTSLRNVDNDIVRVFENRLGTFLNNNVLHGAQNE